jgi:hypothetical protein
VGAPPSSRSAATPERAEAVVHRGPTREKQPYLWIRPLWLIAFKSPYQLFLDINVRSAFRSISLCVFDWERQSSTGETSYLPDSHGRNGRIPFYELAHFFRFIFITETL